MPYRRITPTSKPDDDMTKKMHVKHIALNIYFVFNQRMTLGSRITQKINPKIKTHPVQQSKRGKNVAMVSRGLCGELKSGRKE